MKLLMPVAIALLGLGVGLGAGVALKPAPPAPEEAHLEAPVCVEGAACTAAAADPFTPVAPPVRPPEGETANVELDKPFVVPVFRDDAVAAMMVASMAVEVSAEGAAQADTLQPRLRDALLGVMFRHANSGGFDGAFTEGRKMDDLRAALVQAAQTVFVAVPVYDVLITEIVRQDM